METELLKIRCPECLKLYSVDRTEVHEPRPKFQCRDCQTKFWVTAIDETAAGDEVLGFPINWLESTPEVVINDRILKDRIYSCPKCREPYASGQYECTKCGLIFTKFFEKSLLLALKQDDGWAVEPEIKQAWANVMIQYNDFSIHRKFIELAAEFNCLDYAAKRYAVILENCPEDENAKNAQKNIVALATARFENRPRSTSSPRVFENIDLFMRRVRFTSLILLLCGIVITMGVLMPADRNLVGIGSSVLFFILILRYYFRVI